MTGELDIQYSAMLIRLCRLYVSDIFCQYYLCTMIKRHGYSNVASQMAVIEMLTGHSRKHPFTPQDYGTIEAGQLAELIILSRDPLQDLASATYPTVVIKGRIVVVDKR